jgi:penicillin-binding protein-related factor A (putative recombinase)
MIAIETKFKKKFSAFSVRDMRPSQIVNLTNIAKAGGQSYVFLGIKEPGFPSKLFIFRWSYLEEIFSAGKSISAKELRTHYYLESYSSGDFDLTRWKDRATK